MSSAHSMNARKCVHAQKPYPSQAFAHESSKRGGKREGEEKERERKKRGRGKREEEEKERKRKKRGRGKREEERQRLGGRWKERQNKNTSEELKEPLQILQTKKR